MINEVGHVSLSLLAINHASVGLIHHGRIYFYNTSPNWTTVIEAQCVWFVCIVTVTSLAFSTFCLHISALVSWFDYAQQYRRSPACLVVGIISSVCQPVCAFSICKRNWYSHYHDRVETACGSHSVMGEQLSSISSLQLQSWCSWWAVQDWPIRYYMLQFDLATRSTPFLIAGDHKREAY